MATSGLREGGRESAPPTPSESSTEEKPRTSDNDVQQMIGYQDKLPTQPQWRSSSWKLVDPQPPHFKEEEERWITQEEECLLGQEEADLTKLPLTVVSVKTEDKPSESLRRLCPSGGQQLIGYQDKLSTQPQLRSSNWKQADPQPPHVKEEEEELCTIEEGECLLGPKEADLTKLPMSGVSVKAKDHEDKSPESSQLHHSPSEENKSSSSSPQHTTDSDGDHCGGTQADSLLAPLSDSEDAMSHSAEDEDRDHGQEPLSSDTDWEGDVRTHTDNKHSECSKKKTGKKRFTCSVCAKSFPCKRNLAQHMRTHTGEKPFICSVCGQAFSFQSGMIRHMRRHTGEKSFACSICGQKFAFQSGMVRHMRTHMGEKPFGCSVCGQRFTRKFSMVSHMRVHTEEKPFGCSVCGQRFTRKFSMVSHMRVHTEEKPFGCTVCGQTFSRKSGMVQHMRMHTGHKPYSCTVCGKRFIRKGDVGRHMSTHTGHKPLSCSVCGKSYSCKNRLTAHMQTHKRE